METLEKKRSVDERIIDLERFEQDHLKNHQELMSQLKPITDAFNNVTGFGNVSIMILKALGMVGVGLGVLYELVKFLRK